MAQLTDIVREHSSCVQAAASEIRKAIVGQSVVADRLLVALLCRGPAEMRDQPALAEPGVPWPSPTPA